MEHLVEFIEDLLSGDVFAAALGGLAGGESAGDELVMLFSVVDLGADGVFHEAGEGLSIVENAFGGGA